ncbi:MAG: hypothetical protein ACE5KK_04170 [Candidatus Brocadiales bacterium]
MKPLELVQEIYARPSSAHAKTSREVLERRLINKIRETVEGMHGFEVEKCLFPGMSDYRRCRELVAKIDPKLANEEREITDEMAIKALACRAGRGSIEEFEEILGQWIGIYLKCLEACRTEKGETFE